MNTRLERFFGLGSDLEMVEEVDKGDYPGHPFRGNQWTKVYATAKNAGEAASFVCSERLAEVTQSYWEKDRLQIQDDEYYRQHYISSGYERINEVLRAAKGKGSGFEPADAIDRMFDRAGVKLLEDSYVYRGMALDTRFYSEADFPVGKTFTDHGYTSTSVDYEIARGPSFTGVTRGRKASDMALSIVSKIKLPKGTVVLGGDDSEGELILKRGTKFRISKSSFNKDGLLELEMEVVK